MSTQAGKEVIYIDVDDEITVIIDKVRGSGEKIVALVLPKRATVLQSIVNMKLLKRTADEAKKHLVLITSETGLLPLAGSVGIYVAKTLQSRPEIPPAPAAHGADDNEEEAVDMGAGAGSEPLDKSASVGEHAKKSPKSAVAPVDPSLADEDHPIELDNTSTGPAAAAAGAGKKGKKGRKFGIPDFNKFRLWLVIGGVAIVVFVVMWYMAFVSLPRADITIKTDSTALSSSMDVTLDTEADTADIDEGVVPALAQTTQKTFTQQAEATGQLDKGTKASGQVTLTLKDCSQDQVSIPAGAGLSANGLTFITQQSATLTSVKVGPQCRNSEFPQFSSRKVDVVAQGNGDKYNIPAATYTVASASNVSGTGTAMSGGTSNIVKVVSQSDIDSAKQKIAAQDTAAIKQELKQGLGTKGWFVIEATFKAAESEVTTSAKVGDEAANVNVTEKITYSMMGTKESDLKKLVANDLRDKIDENKQSILDYGLTDAVYKLQNQQDKTTLISLDATVVAGSDLNLDEIRKQVAGKKSGDAKQLIGDYPGVTNVDVNYRPFWVSKIPKNTGKINITVEKPVIKNQND